MPRAQHSFVIARLPEVASIELASRGVLDALLHQLYALAEI
jgi:hypothetical protein